ncbi:MAG: hypothetical protein ROR55_07970 [Devosia sp.]
MRRFNDTLPVLREALADAPPPLLAEGVPPGAFSPAKLAKIIADVRQANLDLEGKSSAGEAGGAAKTRQRSAVRPIDAKDLLAPRERRPREDQASGPHKAHDTSVLDHASGDGENDGAEPDAPDLTPEAALEAAVQARLETALEAARKDHEAERDHALQTARNQWVENEGKALAQAIEASFVTLHETLSDAIGRCVAKLWDARVQEMAVERFAAMLEKNTSPSARNTSLTVRGPVDLLEATKAALESADGINFDPADQPEITVDIGKTRIETAVTLWSQQMKRAVEASEHG